MPHFTSVSADECKDIECAVCLEPWDMPIELDPCRHVFCRACAQPLDKCPDCRAKIKGRKDPNRILANLANAAQMRCETCRWTGSREASRSHQCQSSGAPAPPPPQPAIHHQHQQQQHQPRVYPAPAPQPYHAPPVSAAPPSHDAQPWRAYGLDQDEYDHIFAVFMTFDTDGSGELDRSELKTLCRWLNYAHSDADVEAMFRAMDADGSGALSMHEFCSWISTHRPDPQSLYGLTPLEYNQVLFQFHTFDHDQNGALDLEEFVGLALRQGYARDANGARSLFQMVDTDRSGAVDLHELLTYRARHTGHIAPNQQAPQQQQHWQQHPPPQQQPPYPQQQGGAWQHHEYPAPAPHGERPRYDGGHSVPPTQWQPQQGGGYPAGPPPPPQQQQQQQPYPYPGNSAPPQQQQQYDPSRPYPAAQPQQQSSNQQDQRRGKKGDCVIA
jgi:Ca2+-binding EF-hand superfamily protein